MMATGAAGDKETGIVSVFYFYSEYIPSIECQLTVSGPKCNNMNYASRDRCNGKDCDFEKKDLDDMACSYRFMGGAMGSPQGPGPAMGSMGHGGLSQATLGGYGSPLRRPGDWDCPR